MWRIIATFIYISVTLSVVKYFNYKINDYYNTVNKPNQFIQNYPLKLSITRLDHSDKMAEIIWINIFSLISDLINYPVFWILNFGIDIYTSVRLKETLAEKLKNVRNEEIRAKKEKEYSDAINRSISMIRSNFITNLLLKIPVVINSIFELLNIYTINKAFVLSSVFNYRY